jgi:hypothetical protein
MTDIHNIIALDAQEPTHAFSERFDLDFGDIPLPDGHASIPRPETLVDQRVDGREPQHEASSSHLYSSLPPEKKTRRGRPRTRAWHECDCVANLKVTRTISGNEAKLFLDAVAHAERIGRELNYWIHVKPEHLDAMPPEQRSAFWIDEREWLAQCFRDLGAKLTDAWVREAATRAGLGEHQHLLFHLPKKLRAPIRSALIGRYGSKPILALGPASTMPWRMHSGHYGSAPAYMLKGLAPKVARQTNMLYRPTGPVAGKRIGWTEDLGPKAIAVWRAQHGVFT